MFSDHKPCYCTIGIKHEFSMGDDLLDLLEDAPPRFKWDHNNPLIGRIFLDGQEDGDVKEKLGSLATYSCNNKNDVSILNNELKMRWTFLANFLSLTRSLRTNAIFSNNLLTLHWRQEEYKRNDDGPHHCWKLARNFLTPSPHQRVCQISQPMP